MDIIGLLLGGIALVCIIIYSIWIARVIDEGLEGLDGYDEYYVMTGKSREEFRKMRGIK